jgi:hypothetical protein
VLAKVTFVKIANSWFLLVCVRCIFRNVHTHQQGPTNI